MTKENLPKAQHYVPQFILKNFCIGDTAQIHVFDKKREVIFKSHVKNVAVEKGFYDLEINGITASMETNLGKLESLASGVINRIIAEESLANLSNDEKFLFSCFIAAQFARVKQSRLTLEQMNDGLAEKLHQMGFDLHNISGFKPSNATDIKKVSIAGLEGNIVNLAPYIYDKSWVLFKAPDSESYYISDNPVTLQNRNDYGPYGNLGLAVEGIEIYFPLTKKLSLGMLCRSYEKMIQSTYLQFKVVKMVGLLKHLKFGQNQIYSLEGLKHAFDTGEAVQSRKENVINKNSLQVMNSSRFVFSGVENFGLLRRMLEDNPNFKNPPSIQIN